MDESQLHLLDRGHEVEEVARRVREARAAGMESVSLDLIYGLPGPGATK